MATTDESSMLVVGGMGYLKSIAGIAKIGQEVANFAGIISIAVGWTSPRGDAFLACSIIAFIVTAAFLVCYVAQLVVKVQLPWYKIEFFFCIPWMVFYIIVSSLVIATRYIPYVVGGTFGLLAVVLYGVDAFHKFKIM